MAVSALRVHGANSFYRRHEPENTVLYKVVSENWKTFLADAERESENQGLPKYIKKEFEGYIKCGILQYGFLRVQCESCKDERLIAFSCKKRGFCPSCGGRRMSEMAAKLSDYVIPHVCVRQWVLSVPIPMRYWLSSNPRLVTSVLEVGMRTLNRFYRSRARAGGIAKGQTGAITFIQRFGSALNLNVHFHILFLDGVFSEPTESESLRFHHTDPPSDGDIRNLVQLLALRITRHLKRKGYPKDDAEIESAADSLASQSTVLATCVAASVQNKSAFGERAGKYVRKLGIHPIDARTTGYRSASANGFSLHGGVSVEAKDRRRLEHLIRYVARPSIVLERLSWTQDGNLIYRLKRIFSDGTTHVLFSPMELLEKLVALVPRPNVHLIRYHGVLAPHARIRPKVVPRLPSKKIVSIEEERASNSKRISWARLLKRVFEIDISICSTCSGNVKVISAILEQNVARRILGHLKLPVEPPRIASARAPPQGTIQFDDTF